VISPGLTSSELTRSISDSGVKEAVEGQMGIAIPAAAIGEAIHYQTVPQQRCARRRPRRRPRR
jgi:hypothetical protein